MRRIDPNRSGEADTQLPSPWTAGRRPDVHLPKPVNGAIGNFLRTRFKKARGKVLAHAVADLSDLFTVNRAALPPAYLSQPEYRSAYLAYFHPLQALRGISALSESIGRASIRGLFAAPEGRPLRIVDLGAGLGALTQAWMILQAVRRGPLGRDGAWPEFVQVEPQRAAALDARDLTLDMARALLPGREPPVVHTVVESAQDWTRDERARAHPADVLLVGGVLNEWGGEWEPALRALLANARDDALVVIVEPAIPETGRRLMALREAFLGATTTIAPCTHGATCPLLALSKDWCFTTHAAKFPGPVRELAEGLHHQTSNVRYALWTFRAGATGTAFDVEPARHARVVTDAMGGEQVLCSEGATKRVLAPNPAWPRGTLLRRG